MNDTAKFVPKANRHKLWNQKLYRQQYEYLWNTLQDLLPRNIAPTDIDAAIHVGAMVEMNDRFLLIEAKSGTAPLPTGQKLALTRMVDKLGPGSALAVVQQPKTAVTANLDRVKDFTVYGRGKWYPSTLWAGDFAKFITAWVAA
jgi:hypothetical protein